MGEYHGTSAAVWADLVEKGIISNQQAQVFWALFCLDTPVTDSELSTTSGFELYQIRRRRGELVKASAVQSVEKRKCTVTGVTCWTWQVIPGVTVENFRALMAAYKEDTENIVCPQCHGRGKVPDLSFLEGI